MRRRNGRPALELHPLARAIACGLALLTAAVSPATAQGDLDVPVQDAAGTAGGRVAISVRTFASRPVSQGQLCIRALSTALSPFVAIDSSEVFSGNNDAVVTDQSLIPDGVFIQFESPTASINVADGPLLVIFVDLRGDLTEDEIFPLTLDLPNSVLLDDLGQPIDLASTDAVLEVVGELDPLEITTEAEEEALPGEEALVVFETEFIVPWSSAEFDFLYPAEIVSGTPEVTIDPRFGAADLRVDHSVPGVLSIEIMSLDGMLNAFPGDLVEVILPLSEDVELGSQWDVSIDPDTAIVLDAVGNPLELDLDDGRIVIGDELFDDDFDSGDFEEWSLVVPDPDP